MKSTMARQSYGQAEIVPLFYVLNRFGTRFWLHSSTHSLEALSSYQPTSNVVWCTDHAAPKQILLACLSSSSPRSWADTMQCHLDALNLPDTPTLTANTPSTGIWHRCVDRLITCQSQLNLLEEAESKRDLDLMIWCCTKPGAPAPHWKITHSAEMLHPTTRSNFRMRLLLGCHGLESDATRFRVRGDGSPNWNPTCKLCNSGGV